MPNLACQGIVEFMGGARRSREGTVNAAKGLDETDRRRGSTLYDMKHIILPIIQQKSLAHAARLFVNSTEDSFFVNLWTYWTDNLWTECFSGNT